MSPALQHFKLPKFFPPHCLYVLAHAPAEVGFTVDGLDVGVDEITQGGVPHFLFAFFMSPEQHCDGPPGNLSHPLPPQTVPHVFGQHTSFVEFKIPVLQLEVDPPPPEVEEITHGAVPPVTHFLFTFLMFPEQHFEAPPGNLSQPVPPH